MIRLKSLLSESLVSDPEFRERVKEWEGKVTDSTGLHVAYDDATMKPVRSAKQVQGVVTIGYGTTKSIYPALKPGMKISEKTAEDLLTKGIQKIENNVRRLMPKYDSYPKYIQMAIMNASYRGDLGPASIKLINAGKWDMVSKEYLNHKNYTNPGRMTGVVKRMKSNADAFNRYAAELKQKRDNYAKKKSITKTSKQTIDPNIKVGTIVYPRRTATTDFANIRSSMEVNNGWIENRIETIKWPNAAGKVISIKKDAAGKVWYYLDLPMKGFFKYQSGYVRADVVTSNKSGK